MCAGGFEGQVWATSREIRIALDALSSAPTIRALNAGGLSLLSQRELQVVHHLAEGLTNREIGACLGLSRHTIKNYLLKIFDKLGVSNRVEQLFLTLSQSSAQMPSLRRTTEHVNKAQWKDCTALLFVCVVVRVSVSVQMWMRVNFAAMRMPVCVRQIRTQ